MSNVIPIFGERAARPVRVRCEDCKHITYEYRDIDIGWCSVQKQYRTTVFKRFCQDYEKGDLIT